MLLKRAAESVARQTYKNYIWVVVNDGGDEGAVREVLGSCNVDQDRIHLISNKASVGMEAASNIGIRATRSNYILIHDDDDTVHEDFLDKTVSFLESSAGSQYGGVVTGTDYVSEEIRDDEIIVHGHVPYLDWVKSIDLSELMAQNIITTISFLYRREIFDQIGGYKENLPVLGDWYFNIEFVLRADVRVLPQVLACYHHRDRGQQSDLAQYSNTVVEGRARHEEFAAVCRNMLIREHLHESGISAAVIMGYFAKELRNPLANPGGGGGVSARSQDVKGTKDTSTDLDRLWLLSLVLHRRAHQSVISINKIPPVDLGVSFAELVRLIKKYRISILPPDSFDETLYLSLYPDVAREVEHGRIGSGYEHYVLNGNLEGRKRPTTL